MAWLFNNKILFVKTGSHPQPDKGHLQKPTPNIVPNSEKLDTFPRKQNKEQDKDVHSCHLYLILYWRS